MSNILVTGGLGLIGHHVVKRLQDQGGEPAPMSVKQFRDFIKVESMKFQRIVDMANITPE